MRTTTLLLGLAALGLAAQAQAQTAPWTQLTPGGVSMPSLERVNTATDGTVLYAFGGQDTPGNYLRAFDGTSWTEVEATSATGPIATAAGAMAWDTARGKLVLFGGRHTVGAVNLNDTWEWDAVNGWVQRTPATTTPDARWLIANGVYVPGVGVVFHGGNAVDSLGASYVDNQTWAWNGTDWSVLATGPTRTNGVLVYRSSANDLIYYGGTDATTASAETWSLDLGSMTWSQIVTATLPVSENATGGPGHTGVGGYYHPVLNRVFIHGGQGNGGPPSQRTWMFDGTDWTDVSDPTDLIKRNFVVQYVSALGKAYTYGCNSAGQKKNWTLVHDLAVAPWTAYCFGDGSGTACPCGNAGGAGEGCANGTGAGAVLSGTGSASIGAADLVLSASQLPVNQPTLFFQGDNAVNGGAGNIFGDGLRCAGGNVIRLQVRVSDGSGVAATTVGVAATGGVVLGDVKRYQGWYRDPVGSPCGSFFNLSNGLEVTWDM